MFLLDEKGRIYPCEEKQTDDRHYTLSSKLEGDRPAEIIVDMGCYRVYRLCQSEGYCEVMVFNNKYTAEFYNMAGRIVDSMEFATDKKVDEVIAANPQKIKDVRRKMKDIIHIIKDVESILFSEVKE